MVVKPYIRLFCSARTIGLSRSSDDLRARYISHSPASDRAARVFLPIVLISGIELPTTCQLFTQCCDISKPKPARHTGATSYYRRTNVSWGQFLSSRWRKLLSFSYRELIPRNLSTDTMSGDKSSYAARQSPLVTWRYSVSFCADNVRNSCAFTERYKLTEEALGKIQVFRNVHALRRAFNDLLFSRSSRS